MTHLPDTDEHTASGNEPDDAQVPPEDWSAQLAPRRPATRRSQLVLASLAIASLGFVGGIAADQRLGDDESATALPGGLELPEGVTLPEGFSPSSGAGLPGLPGATGAATTYTVTVVDGSTLYLQDPTGATVKVVTLPSTTVRALGDATTRALRPGDTVAVEGDPDEGGTIVADSVEQTG